MVFFLLYYQEWVLRNKKTGDLSDLLPRSLSYDRGGDYPKPLKVGRKTIIIVL